MEDVENIVTETLQAWKDEGVLHPRRAAQDVLATLDAEGYVVKKATTDERLREALVWVREHVRLKPDSRLYAVIDEALNG